jgi:hypothetical protein
MVKYITSRFELSIILFSVYSEAFEHPIPPSPSPIRTSTHCIKQYRHYERSSL